MAEAIAPVAPVVDDESERFDSAEVDGFDDLEVVLDDPSHADGGDELADAA